MRGLVIVQGQYASHGPNHLLLVNYQGGGAGLVEIAQLGALSHDGAPYIPWLLSGIAAPTGVDLFQAMPLDVLSAGTLDEVGTIGEDTRVLRLTLTKVQVGVLHYHFATLGGDAAKALMQDLPLYGNVLGRPRTIVGGQFMPVWKLREDGSLPKMLGDELAEIALPPR